MSQEQEIEVEDLCTEKKFFTQIPNIIHRMGLGPYIVSYYCLLKSIAGEKGHCFTGQKKLCQMLGCSDRQLRLMNKFMSQPFEILGGKPLIKITHRKDESGVSLPNLVQVVDIWIENVTVLNSKTPIPQTPMPKTEASIKEKIGAERSSPPPEPGSGRPEPGSDKEEPRYNNPGKNISLKDLGKETLAPYKNKVRTLDIARHWKLSGEQYETFLFLQGLSITDSKGNVVEEGQLAWWARNYSQQRLIEVYHEAKSYKPNSMRAYMKSLLENNKQVPKAHSQMNREFAHDFLKANPLPKVKITKNYIKVPIGSDYTEINFNMDPQDFIYRLMEKHENSRGQ